MIQAANAHRTMRPTGELIDQSIYNSLRCRAKAMLRQETADHRLEPTELVHEAFVRMARGPQPVAFHDTHHLLAITTVVMRHILIDNGRSAGSPNRWRPVPLDPELELFTSQAGDMLFLHDILRRLAVCDARLHAIVKMRFFLGLNLEEIASELSVSTRTVKRDWTAARTWLRRELGRTVAPGARCTKLVPSPAWIPSRSLPS
jgi:RNA polymerase sigma factor (TIGR02999 family)